MTEFKSQICTTVEQSKRLLGLGLKKETADMTWKFSNTIKGKDHYDPEAHHSDPSQKDRWIASCENADYLSHWFKPDGSPMTAEEVYEAVWGKDIPAWSLHRLIEMMPKTIGRYFQYTSNDSCGYMDEDALNMNGGFDEGNIYDSIINCIEWLIKEGYFNKEYLEE